MIRNIFLKYLDNSVNFKDITDDYACLGIFGPKSRNLVSKVFGQNFSNDDFKFGTGKYIEFNEIQIVVSKNFICG